MGMLSANDKAHPRRPLVKRNVSKNRNAVAVGCSDWILIMASLGWAGACPKGVEIKGYKGGGSAEASGSGLHFSPSTTNLFCTTPP
jgi:hypothetical protein